MSRFTDGPVTRERVSPDGATAVAAARVVLGHDGTAGAWNVTDAVDAPGGDVLGLPACRCRAVEEFTPVSRGGGR
jgi:hypothetical protein